MSQEEELALATVKVNSPFPSGSLNTSVSADLIHSFISIHNKPRKKSIFLNTPLKKKHAVYKRENQL
jgi:hypothetical protein